MRILWLSHLVPYPPRSGVAQRSYGLLRELCKRHDVTLFTFHQPDLMRAMSNEPEAELQRAITHLEGICSRVELVPIPMERNRYARYAVAAGSLLRGQSFTENWLRSNELIRLISREGASRYDVVHFDTISLARYRPLFRNALCVMNHHNIESHLLLRRAKKSRSPAARAYFRHEGNRLQAYECRTAGQFDLHVTCSDLDAERLAEVRPGIDCRVIPNGVDTEYFVAQPHAVPAPTFCFVGSLGWGPNREAAEILATELWPHLARSWPDATLTLVGSKPPDVAVALARRDARFRVTGYVDDVRPHIAESSFFICPIRDGGGTKLKVLNAMGMAAVVIADPIACEGIGVTEGRDVLFASTPEQYVGAVRSMLEAPSAYRTMAESAHALIEREYSYEVIGERLDRYYTAALQRS